jgi:Fe-S cluster assembly iron-binding protein IscA
MVLFMLLGCQTKQDIGSPASTKTIAPTADSERQISTARISSDGVAEKHSGDVAQLTERAALAVRAIVQRQGLDQRKTYLRIEVHRKSADDYRYELNITKNVDPTLDVLDQSRGIQIVVDRRSLPWVRGGTVDFVGSGKSGEFQFRKATSDRSEPHNQRGIATNSEDGGISNAGKPTDIIAPKNIATLARRPSRFRPSDPYSNIHAHDYVGPQTCGKCHAEQYKLWQAHPHSKMTRDAGDDSVVGDFSGSRLDYANGRVIFEKVARRYLMSIYLDDQFVRRFQVTRTIGSRIFQMYIGVQSVGPEPADDPTYTQERKLPFAYWVGRRQWFPEMYDEPVAPQEFDDAGTLTAEYAFHTTNTRPVWREQCLWCHNTYPYEARLQNRLVGFPPDDLRLIRVGRAVPRGTSRHTLAFPPDELVTLGISCESCHFGGREHAVENREIRFVPFSPDLEFPRATPELVQGARRAPYVVNSICAQCHSVQQRKFPNMASCWNSGEATDLKSGNCTGAVRCTDCHNPHQAGPALSGGPDRSEHLAACTKCHDQFQSESAARSHSRHSADRGVSCLDCHMPRIVHGLHTLVRTHQISSPTDPRMFAKAAPNACNLCHLDKSIEWTLDELASGWNQRFEPTAEWSKWYGGDLREPVGLVWLRHPSPLARQIAADAYARSPVGHQALPLLLPILNDENPPTRMFGMFAIEKILGRQFEPAEYSPWSTPEVRKRQVDALIAP